VDLECPWACRNILESFLDNFKNIRKKSLKNDNFVSTKGKIVI
jgi:hypothetical protein